MEKDRIVFGLTAVFAAMTALVTLVGLVFGEPVLFFVVLPLAAATYMFWYQSSGKLRERLRETQRRREAQGAERGGFGAGPREGFESARGQQAREAWERQQRQQQQQRRRQGGPQPSPNVSPSEAYRRLGLDAGADESEVKRAYRQKVKEVHPDRGGDEKEFKKITEAYEALTG
ncbi:MAG: hypothetical protein ACI8UR_002341 [Natronomonas sp.]|uniref:J domain-containing protein n=1 Tax=Natronomonas sp. TaxID=2184060 RepID=UPI003988F68E